MDTNYTCCDYFNLIKPEKLNKANKELYDKLDKFYTTIKYRSHRMSSIVNIFKEDCNE